MKRRNSMWRKMLAGLLCLSMAAGTLATSVSAQDVSEPSFAQKISDRFADPEMDYKVETRWWLAEGSHTDETLIESIHELYDAGIGAVEFVTLDESKYLDDATYAWGSEEWIHDSHLIVEECTKLGMGVSFTSGTNWGTANLISITPDDPSASQELGYKTINLSAGERYSRELPMVSLPAGATKARLERVVAARADGVDEKGKTILAEESLNDVTALAKQDAASGQWSIDYTAPEDGDYILFTFWQYGTAESFRPSVGTSYTINYLSPKGAEALIEYWEKEVLTEDLRKMIKENGDVSMYMDSLESLPRGKDSIYKLWTEEYLEEFEKRCGYDLSKYLPITISNSIVAYDNTYVLSSDEENLGNKIRDDCSQVSTELYTENCLQVIRDWVNSFGMTLRHENSYSNQYEISQPIKAIDYVETESLEFAAELDSYRGQAGGAHLYDKLYSSETGAILMGNYKYSNDYFRQIYYTQFAAGVQRTILHGYSSEYGPEKNVAWPGYEGMNAAFAERFNKRQPNSLDYPDLNRHLARVQKALRQGTVQMDLGILRTDYFYDTSDWIYMGKYEDNYLHRHEGIYWQDTTLQDAGYTYDYFSPYLLQDADITCENGLVDADGTAYQALLLYQEELPYESAQRLLAWAKDGLPVVLVDGPTKENLVSTTYIKDNRGAALTTGRNDGKDEALAQVMTELRALDNVVSVPTQAAAYDALISLGVRPRAEYLQQDQQNLLSVLRKDDDASYLYLYNYMYTDTENYVGQVSVDGIYKPYVLDTWSGKVDGVGVYSYENGRTILNVDIGPGDMVMFALDPNDADDTQATITQTSANVCRVDSSDDNVTMCVSESGLASLYYSDGSTYELNVEAPQNVSLNQWNLTVESWEPGEKIFRTEDRGFGYTTTEAAYTTSKRNIEVGETSLVPWKDIQAVGPAVSGVGTYTNTFTLPQNWDESNGAIFKVDSVNGGTVMLKVNGQKVPINMDNATADISAYVRPGENSIEVRVTTNLNNRKNNTNYARSNSYGMVGEAALITYTKVDVCNPAESVLSASAPESAQVNAEFDVTVVTDASVTDVRLFNENDMAIGRKAVAVADNEDGTKTWTITVAIGTVGENRTLKVVTKGPENYLKDSGKTISINITSVPPVLNSFNIPDTAVANRTFIVQATTDMAATKINVYNEFGAKMGIKSLTYKVVDGQKVWTGVMAIGTKGDRTFTAYAVNKYGAQSEVLTDSVSVKAFA